MLLRRVRRVIWGVNMSTVSVIVRIQLSAESAPAYAEAAKAVVAATREEAG